MSGMVIRRTGAYGVVRGSSPVVFIIFLSLFLVFILLFLRLIAAFSGRGVVASIFLNVGAKFARIWESSRSLRLSCPKSLGTTRESPCAVSWHFRLVVSEDGNLGCRLFDLVSWVVSTPVRSLSPLFPYSLFSSIYPRLGVFAYPGLSSECAFRSMCVLKI